MKKIISVFQRNYDTDRLIRDELVPGAEWVAAGEGTATQKFDGTCCLVKDGVLYKRYDAKQGKQAASTAPFPQAMHVRCTGRHGFARSYGGGPPKGIL